MSDPVVIQAVSTIVAALITAIASIIVAYIQTSRHHKPEEPKILIPSGAKIYRRNQKALPVIILFTILGGALGYFISRSFFHPIPSPAPNDLFFTDDFLAFDDEIWEIENPEKWVNLPDVKNDTLYFDFTNDGEDWSSQNVVAKNYREYSAIEFEIVILEASGASTLTFNTNCHGENKGSLFIETGRNLKFDGNYEEYENTPPDYENDIPNRPHLAWKNELSLGESYKIFLSTDDERVRVSINGLETREPFPCNGMGPNIIFGSTASKGHHIKGYIDNVKAWK